MTQRVHIIGVAGAGMSGLARLLVGQGYQVSGCDAKPSSVLDELADSGVVVNSEHDANHVEGIDLLLWSPAVTADHPERVRAAELGIETLDRASMLAKLGRENQLIGVTGTHGKTTATSMLAWIMAESGRDVGRLLGADVRGLGPNGYYGNDGLVVEVDESYGTFSQVAPYALALLNIEADHLDYYGNLQALETAFQELTQRTTGPVVFYRTDPGARRVGDALDGAVAVGAGGDWLIEDVSLDRRGASFSLVSTDHRIELSLGVTGRHNVANAAVVAVLARELGISDEHIVRGLQQFRGAPRRFEFRGTFAEIDIFEDYAHLPGEIAATLEAALDAGYERVGVVFQPHRISRTTALASELAESLKSASWVLVTDIYDAGEDNPNGITGELVATPLSQIHADSSYVSGLEQIWDELANQPKVDAIFFLGAGDVAQVIPNLESR